jgi:hypothetical protein
LRPQMATHALAAKEVTWEQHLVDRFGVAQERSDGDVTC